MWLPVLQQLTQGLAPEKLALTIAIGFVIAVIPVIGTTTVLCTAAAIILRLNQPVIQMINYLSAPLQIICILPWIRAGELLFRAESLKLSPSEVVNLVTTQPGLAISTLWVSTLHATVAWLVAAPLLGLAIYFSVLPFLRMATARMKKTAPAPDEVLDAG
jgi:uncharacterized protein (DUF2062 family)